MPHGARAVAQSLTPVWITDDILAEAFNRFARVCHHQTYTWRRYGSNIPGPLEARRRQARRRMGLSVAAASNGPPPVDLGALFGLGARPPTNPEKSLRWEPPSLQQSTLGVGPPPPPPRATVKAWSPFAQPKKEKQVWRAVDPKALLIAAINTSQAAFQDVLATLESHHTISKEAMTSITDFMHTSADEPKARNLLTLAHWLSDRAPTAGAAYVLACCVRDKAVLRTLPEDEETVVSILDLLLERGPGAKREVALAETLDALPKALSQAAVVQLSKLLRYRLVLRPENEELAALTRFWFRILDSRQFMQGKHATHPTWRAVYQEFADILKPQQLASHFALMAGEDFAAVLLAYWVPALYMRGEEAQDPQAVDYGTSTLLSLRPQTAGAGAEQLSQLMEDFVTLRAAPRADDAARASADDCTSSLVDLLAVLASHRIPYACILNDIFDTLKAQLQPETAVWRLLIALKRNPRVGIPTSIADSLVYYFMTRPRPRPPESHDVPPDVEGHRDIASQSPNISERVYDYRDENLYRAWLVFRAVPSLSVLQCLDLPIKLVKHGYGSPDRIFYMLNRTIGPEVTLPEFRKIRRNALQPEHVDLVHLVAYTWATQEHTSSNVAFRRVWATYRFLQDRGAPLSVLMSRSLVKAGLLRPIQEGKMVPVARRQYIFSLVQRLEGDEIARDLDRLVFHLNKTNLIPNYRYPAKDFSVSQGWRTGKGIAKVVKYRLRSWKRKIGRLYTVDGPVGGSRGGRSTRSGKRIAEGLAALRDIVEDSEEHDLWRQEVDEATERDGVEGYDATGKNHFDAEMGESGMGDPGAVLPPDAARPSFAEAQPASVKATNATEAAGTVAEQDSEEVTAFVPFTRSVEATPTTRAVHNGLDDGTDVPEVQRNEAALPADAAAPVEEAPFAQEDSVPSETPDFFTAAPQPNNTDDLSAIYFELSERPQVLTEAVTSKPPTHPGEPLDVVAWETWRRERRQEEQAAKWQDPPRQKQVEQRALSRKALVRTLQWHKRRKRLGYDPHDKSFTS